MLTYLAIFYLPQSNFIQNKPVYVIDTTQSNKHYKVDR